MRTPSHRTSELFGGADFYFQGLIVNERNLDIQCVRIRPCLLGSEILLEIRPIIHHYQKLQIINSEFVIKDGRNVFTENPIALPPDMACVCAAASSEAVETRTRISSYSIRSEKRATPDDLAAIMPQHRRSSLWRSSDGIVRSEELVAAVTDTSRREGRNFDERRSFGSDDELFHIDDY
jgi:hypothetical protein